MSYRDLLKKAMEKMPKKVVTRKRFELPEIVCEIQGNKTLVKNFGEILNVLRRDASHLSKYLFKELATPGTIRGNTLILQRKVPKEILKKKMESYLREFVYCKVCGEPDTKLIKEGRLAFIRCEACGAKTPVKVI